MRKQNILVVSDNKKEGSSLGAILGALTAILTALTGLFFLTGYLFLTGYYSTFNLPVSLIGLSTQTVLIMSAVLLIPIFSVLMLFLGAGFLLSGAKLERLKDLPKKPGVYVAASVYLLLAIFTIPATGRWFANKQLSGSFSGYKPLAEPVPFVSVQCKQLLPGLTASEIGTDKSTFTYRNLRMVASNDKYLFLYSPQIGSFLVPRDTVVWMGFYGQEMK
ncbi:MAG: hypothetical protein DMF72_02935 [Acidobacteria bacterium]|nr:MAG: hypothetical protein DMF72_02935 [Acidobacteriota bacterium]